MFDFKFVTGWFSKKPEQKPEEKKPEASVSIPLPEELAKLPEERVLILLQRKREIELEVELKKKVEEEYAHKDKKDQAELERLKFESEKKAEVEKREAEKKRLRNQCVFIYKKAHKGFKKNDSCTEEREPGKELCHSHANYTRDNATRNDLTKKRKQVEEESEEEVEEITDNNSEPAQKKKAKVAKNKPAAEKPTIYATLDAKVAEVQSQNLNDRLGKLNQVREENAKKLDEA